MHAEHPSQMSPGNLRACEFNNFVGGSQAVTFNGPQRVFESDESTVDRFELAKSVALTFEERLDLAGLTFELAEQALQGLNELGGANHGRQASFAPELTVHLAEGVSASLQSGCQLVAVGQQRVSG